MLTVRSLGIKPRLVVMVLWRMIGMMVEGFRVGFCGIGSWREGLGEV